nr:hypothetical protein [Tanacetum cinerariifolium]
MEDDVDINTLTMKQYLAWVQDAIRLAVVKPKIGNDVKFKINSNFMRELRRKLFKGTDDEDAHKHVRRVLEITNLFHFSGITHDAAMLRVFPITLKGPVLRWINRLSTGSITTWDLLKKAFIRQYCPPFKTAKKLEEICNFKQEVDEPLYRTWERSDLLQISAARPDQPTKDHLRNWYDEATTREIIDDSLDDVDIKKLDENIHVFQVSCKTCEGMHLTEDCTLRKEDKAAADDAWIRKFIKNTHSNIRELTTTTKNLQVIDNQLTHTVLSNTSERIKAKTKMGKNDIKELVPRDLPIDYPYAQPIPIPERLKEQKGNLYKTQETVCVIRIPKETHEEKTQINNGCNITVKDVERLRQILTHTIHTLPNLEPVVQPYMPLSPFRDIPLQEETNMIFPYKME